MEIENLSHAVLQRLYQDHQAMTHAALVQVFSKSDKEASLVITELWSRYEQAPERERCLLLHNDPVALACDLAGQCWNEIDQSLLDKFNDVRRPALEQQLGIS
jgi:hypothetical protein